MTNTIIAAVFSLFLLISGPVLMESQDSMDRRGPAGNRMLVSSDKTSAGKPADQGANGKHQDHEAKHGGVFFMALDQEHHLEGAFLKPGIFRVYLYDAYTKPLKKEQMKEASGTIQVGDSEDAPKIPLGVSKDGKTLEVALPDVKFPFTLTLLMHFPDTPADARPELFTFPFGKYTNPNDHPPSTMRGMKM